jgi:hypothetical protein
MGDYLSASVRWAFAERNGRPPVKEREVYADLHAHPCISDKKSLLQTLDACIENYVGLLACTTHNSPKELSFWRVKDLLSKEGPYACDDRDLALVFACKGKKIIMVPAYETRCEVPDVGTMHLVALMPDRAYIPSDRQPFKDCIEECRRHNAIVLAAHPYLICNPDRPRVHVATARERGIIYEKVFPYVDAADAISAAGLWLKAANEHLMDDYLARCIATSDAHGSKAWKRREIGRAGTIFTLGDWISGTDLRKNLRARLQSGNHKKHLRYMSFLGFMGVCLEAFHVPWQTKEPLPIAVNPAKREQTF